MSLFDSTIEFDETLAILLNRLGARREEGRSKLRQAMKDALSKRSEKVRIHNQWNGTSCVPFIDDWVIVFSTESVWDQSGHEQHRIHLLALEQEPENYH